MKGFIKQIAYCTFLFLLLSSFGEVKMTKSIWKKIDKSIINIWPESVPHKFKVDLTQLSFEKITLTGTESLHSIVNDKNEVIGYLMTSMAPSRYDNFDLMVLYDLDMVIVKSDILVYREDWGGEITSPRWLKQFIGKSSFDRLQLNHGIQGISGATISCRSAVEEIKRLTLIMSFLNTSGQLTSSH